MLSFNLHIYIYIILLPTKDVNYNDFWEPQEANSTLNNAFVYFLTMFTCYDDTSYDKFTNIVMND